MMKPYKVTIYVYADDEQQVKDLEKPLTNLSTTSIAVEYSLRLAN